MVTLLPIQTSLPIVGGLGKSSHIALAPKRFWPP
jgi:hypothetical protein